MSTSATSHLLPFRPGRSRFLARRGLHLIATNGERYLDFTSGVAVNALGHAHPHLVQALQEQATKLWHMSNLFKSPDGEILAARLCEQSFADLVFFCNSGAEAMEGVIKLVRHYHFSKGHGERYRIITSKAPSMAARWRRSPPPARPNISKASARRWTASTRSPTAISKPSRRRSARTPPAS